MKEETWIEVSLLDMTCVIANFFQSPSDYAHAPYFPSPSARIPVAPMPGGTSLLSASTCFRARGEHALRSLLMRGFALASLPVSQARFAHCPSPTP
jgi:hypothetical protein